MLVLVGDELRQERRFGMDRDGTVAVRRRFDRDEGAAFGSRVVVPADRPGPQRKAD